MIEKLLNKVPEKYEWRNTTSKKFKYDLYSFFNREEFKTLDCIEIGCAKGHTTLILSKLFNKVYGVNYDSTTDAFNFCKENDCTNVKFFTQDVYTQGFPNVEVDVIMIDAVHTYNAVKSDINNALKMKSKVKKHLIFDDVGILPEVLQCVIDHCNLGIIKPIKKIGCVPGDYFHRPLYDQEGLICIEV